MPTITQLAQSQRKQISDADAANLEALVRAYSLMYSDLEGDVDSLMLAIEKLDKPSQAEIKALPQYKRLMRNAERELDDFTKYLETTVGTAAIAAIGLGLAHSEALVNTATGGGFTGLDTGAMRQLLNFLRKDGPLYARLKLITDSTIDKVVQSILDGVASGFNPRVIASNIQDAFGGGLTDALRNTRTVQIYSYRESARANYISSGVVDSWIWWAELDADTCEACWAEHGNIYPLDETLSGHYNCRCSPIPYIEGLTEQPERGEDLFNKLSEAEQRSIMGDKKYEAYQAGKFQFGDMVRRNENEIYGQMVGVVPLKDLLGE